MTLTITSSVVLLILGCPECNIGGVILSSFRFLLGGVRTGLNISERLKTNDMRTYGKRRYFRHIWKKSLVTIRYFLSLLYAFEYGRKQSAF